jgi:hypothetical protein
MSHLLNELRFLDILTFRGLFGQLAPRQKALVGPIPALLPVWRHDERPAEMPLMFHPVLRGE